jgi:hypothetical protein
MQAAPQTSLASVNLTVAGLVPIPGVRDLPGIAPAQVSFAVNGGALVITEKGSNTITIYTLDDDARGPVHPQL